MNAIPNTSEDFATCGDTEECILCCSFVEIGALLVYKKGVRDPNSISDLGAYRQALESRPRGKRKPVIGPSLTKIEIKCKILKIQKEFFVDLVCN